MKDPSSRLGAHVVSSGRATGSRGGTRFSNPEEEAAGWLWHKWLIHQEGETGDWSRRASPGIWKCIPEGGESRSGDGSGTGIAEHRLRSWNLSFLKGAPLKKRVLSLRMRQQRRGCYKGGLKRCFVALDPQGLKNHED